MYRFNEGSKKAKAVAALIEAWEERPAEKNHGHLAS
jgi:hypothetical protein